MKIAVIGSSKENSTLVEEAEQIFDEVLYVPIDSVKLEVGEGQRALYKDVDLSTFDIILPLPKDTNREFFFLCLKILEKYTYTPISSDNFFIMDKKCLLMKKFIEQGLKVRKSAFLASNRTSKMLIENLKFPIVMRSYPGKRVLVTNAETLNNVLSLFKAGNIRILEKPIEAESALWFFVVGNEIVASYEQLGENVRSISPDGEIISKLFRIKKAVDSDFFVVNFIRRKNSLILNDVLLTPDFSELDKVTGKNTSRLLLIYLKNKVESMRVSPITSLVNSMYSLIRKVFKT